MSDVLDRVENTIAALITEKRQGQALVGACEVLPMEGCDDEAGLWFLEGCGPSITCRGLIDLSGEFDS